LGGVLDAVGLAAVHDALVLVDCLDEHHAGDLGAISRREPPHDEATVGLPHQHVGGIDVQALEGRVELECELGEGARTHARVAPGIPAAVVAAHPRERADPGLHERPDDGEVAGAGLKKHRR